MVLFSTTSNPPADMLTAPPTPPAMLPEMTLLRIARNPAEVNAIAPPSVPAELPESTTSSSAMLGVVISARIAPPVIVVELKPERVTPLIVNDGDDTMSRWKAGTPGAR